MAEGVQDETAPQASTVIDGVASLVDKSLVRRIDCDDREPRFGMLATIQEYGFEQLAAAGECEAAQRTHAAYVIELAEEASRAFRRRSGHDFWLNRLEEERGNFRAALAWLDKSGDTAALIQLTGALHWFWYVRGPISEGRSWLERSIAAGNTDEATIPRVRALVGAGFLAHFQGDDDMAVAWLEKSLALSSDLDDPYWLALTLGLLGTVAEDRGDYGVAEPRFTDALALLREAGDQANFAATLLHLGIVAWGQGDVGRAAELCGEASELQRAVGDTWGLSNALAYLGLLAAERGEHARAAALHRESIGLRWESRTWEDIAGSLADVAMLAAVTGRLEQAARLFGAAAALVEQLGRVIKLPERAVYERVRLGVFALLGQQAFAEAWAAGQKLPLEEAVAEATALTDQIARQCVED